MKQFVFFFLLFCIGLSAQAQTSGFVVKSNQRNTGASTIFSRDTLVNLDTLIVDLFVGDYRNWTIDGIIRCDSISGATTGTVYLQYANDGIVNNRTSSTLTSDQVMWYNVATATLDGAGRTQYRLTGELTARRARLFILTPNSTARRMMITYNVSCKLE